MEGNGTYDFGNGKAPYVGTFAGGQIAESTDTVQTPETPAATADTAA